MVIHYGHSILFHVSKIFQRLWDRFQFGNREVRRQSAGVGIGEDDHHEKPAS